LYTVAVDLIDIADHQRDPRAFVGRLGSTGAEGGGVGALAPPTLAVLTEENLSVPRKHTAEVDGISPVPALLPAELLEPREALLDVGDVEDRNHSMVNPLASGSITGSGDASPRAPARLRVHGP